jgi:hypothetical protein
MGSQRGAHSCLMSCVYLVSRFCESHQYVLGCRVTGLEKGTHNFMTVPYSVPNSRRPVREPNEPVLTCQRLGHSLVPQ